MNPRPLDPATDAALRALGASADAPLAVDGFPLEDLANRFGTPLYVFSAQALRDRLAAVQAALGPRVEVLWSLKANPSVAVTRTLSPLEKRPVPERLGPLSRVVVPLTSQL